MYYRVQAKCGHVGKNYYVLKNFYIRAESGKEAAKKARELPRVKHHHKDAIREVVEICFEDYLSGMQLNDSDMYFKSTSPKEQRIHNCVKKEDIYPEIKRFKYKKQRNGQRIRHEILEKEWRRMIQRGEVSYG